MKRTLTTLIALLAALALLASACGSDDDTATATAEPTEDAVAATSEPDPTPTEVEAEAEEPAEEQERADEPTEEEEEEEVTLTQDDGHDHDHDHGPADIHSIINSLDGVATPGLPVSDYLEVPASAFGPQIDQEKGYFTEEIRNGVWWVTEGVYQSMFIVTADGVIVADAPPSLAAAIPAAIAEATELPITHMIYSHAHTDHIGGAAAVLGDATGVEIVAQEATLVELTEHQDPNRPLPTTTFDEAFTLETGGQTVEMYYPGTNHQEGNIFILVPEADVMMFIDVIFPGWSPWQFLAIAQDIPGFIDASNQLLDYEWETLVSGHVTRLGTREDVEIQNEFITDLRQAAGEALGNNSFGEAFGVVAGNDAGDIQPWAISDVFLDAVVSDCVDVMLPEWGERLAGIDVFLYSHCQAMEQSLRVD